MKVDIKSFSSAKSKNHKNFNNTNFKKIVKTYPWLKKSSKLLYQKLKCVIPKKAASICLQMIQKQCQQHQNTPHFQKECNSTFRHVVFNIKRKDLQQKLLQFDQQQNSTKNNNITQFEKILETPTELQVKTIKMLKSEHESFIDQYYNPPRSALTCPHCQEKKIQSQAATQTRMGTMKTGGIAYICLHYKCDKFMKIVNAY